MFHIRVLPCGYPAAIWGSSFIYAKNIAFSVSVAAAASHAANMAVLVVAVTAGELKMETFPGRELPDGAKRSVQNTNWEVWFAERTWWHLPANPKPLRPRRVHERRQPWRGARGTCVAFSAANIATASAALCLQHTSVKTWNASSYSSFADAFSMFDFSAEH